MTFRLPIRDRCTRVLGLGLLFSSRVRVEANGFKTTERTDILVGVVRRLRRSPLAKSVGLSPAPIHRQIVNLRTFDYLAGCVGD